MSERCGSCGFPAAYVCFPGRPGDRFGVCERHYWIAFIAGWRPRPIPGAGAQYPDAFANHPAEKGRTIAELTPEQERPARLYIAGPS